MRRKWKSFLAITTAFFFCATYIIGCATETAYRQVSREEGKTSEYFLAPDGKQLDVKTIEDAIQKGDIKMLAEISNVYRPTSKERVRPEEYQAGEITLFEDYPGGTKYIKVDANPQRMKIPAGWWPIGLPKDVSMTVGGGKDGKKQTTGTLKKGEVVWVYVVLKDDKPVIDAKKGILLQLGAVKQCGNQIITDIKMWYPLPLLRQAAQKQVEILVLQKVIDRGQATVYMEKEVKDNSKYWLAGALVLTAIGAYFIGKSQSSETVRTVTKNESPPPNTPAVGEPCPPGIPAVR